ncbi:MAG: T9SS type A sorting domain-containing protein [Candidatus Absconditabacterales bacterium]|nr:T9SS type A sorting domain-containing protein [Candidatus Absconditabacterales bacterium]
MKKLILFIIFIVGLLSFVLAQNEEVDLGGAWKATPTATISGQSTICVGGSAQLSISFTHGPVDIVYTDGVSNYNLIGLVNSPHYLSVSPNSNRVYTLVSVNNQDCSGTASGAGIVTVNQLPSANITSVSSTQCFGQANGSATIVPETGAMPFTYHWDNGVTTSINNYLTAGSHSVTVTDANGCQKSYDTTIGEPVQLQLSVANVTNVNCTGVNSGSATVYATGGTTPYTYNWSGNHTGSAVSGLSAGTYTVTVTDANGCSATTSVVVAIDPPLIATIPSHTNVLCAGSNTGTATVNVSGGTAPYSYSWSNGQITSMATGLGAGTYTVTVTDDNGCQAITSVIVTQPTQLVATLTVDNIHCSGTPLGSANVIVTGGTPIYSYKWSTGAITSSVSNLAQGGYALTVTDANGCHATGSPFYFTVGQDPVPVANAIITSGSSSCGGSDVNLLASGGDSYLWSTGATTPEITVNPLAPTWYYVTVTNEFGCSDVDSVFVPVNPMPVISFNLQDDICSDGEPISLTSLATVTPYNGGQVWFTGVGVASNIFYPSTVAVGGTYDIKAHYTDPTTGCYNSVVELITVHHPPTTTLNIPTGTTCIQYAPFVLTGGVPTGGVYSGPGVDNNVFDPALAGAGTHQILYTYTDPYGCIAIASDNIVVNAPVNVVISSPATELCTGDSPINLSATPSGGYYMVDGVSSSANFDPDFWGEGEHTITYSLPSAMCGGDDEVIIVVHSSPIVTLVGPTDVEENADPFQLEVSPPGGQLTVNGQISGVFFDPAYWGVGTYDIVYSYSNGHCEESASLQITIGPVGVDNISLIDIVNVFPNPMSDILNITLDNVEISECQIFDIMGKILYEIRVNSDHLTIDVSEFTPGMYFVRFVMQDGQVSQPFKVMKQGYLNNAILKKVLVFTGTFFLL